MIAVHKTPAVRPNRGWPRAVREAAAALKTHLEARGVLLDDYESAAFVAGRVYNYRVRRPPRQSPGGSRVRAMAAMAVGDSIELPAGASQGSLYEQMKRARALMGEAGALARWSTHRLADGRVRVVRRAPDEPHRLRSVVTLGLVRLKVGQSISVSGRAPRLMHPYYATARRAMGLPTAAFKCRRQGQQLVVERVA